MIARGHEWHDRFAIHEREHAHFIADEVFLEQHDLSRFAECTHLQAVPDRRGRFPPRGTDGNAFARRKPIGLDDHRIPHPFERGEGGVEVGEHFRVCREYARLGKQLLRPCLAALDHRPRTCGAENRDAAREKRVRKPVCQRFLRPNDHEIGTFRYCEVGETGYIIDGNRCRTKGSGNACISRSDEQIVTLRRLRQFPRQRVFPRAATYHKDAHHSHSMVAGGLEVMSYTTRFTPETTFTMRLEMRASTSKGMRAQSAVIASSLVTARIAMACA